MQQDNNIQELKNNIKLLTDKLSEIEAAYHTIKNKDERLANPNEMRNLRLKTGLNHEEFGNIIGVSRSYIYQIEKGGDVGKNRHSNLSKHFEMAINLASILEAKQA